MPIDKEIRNGLIKSTFLGREDHGILTASIIVEGESWGCGFGGLMTVHLLPFIKEVVDLLGQWEKLPGQLVRVEFKGNGMSAISRLGHPIKDKWIDIGKVPTGTNET